jgi:ribose transport system permease protein
VTNIGKTRLFGSVSILLVITLVVCAALSLFYRFTTLGRQMLAAGANARAADLSGIRTGRVIALCHALTGALAALAGLMLTARTGAAVPSMAGHIGQDWLLPAFLAPVLGGTLLSGGRVSVIGTLLGAAFVTIMTSGLLLMRVGEFWILACLGVLLLLAVLTDRLRQRMLRARGLI